MHMETTMAELFEIKDYQDRAPRRVVASSRSARDTLGQILLYTGIRYERMDEADTTPLRREA